MVGGWIVDGEERRREICCEESGERISEAEGLDLICLLVDFVGGKNEKLNNGE